MAKVMGGLVMRGDATAAISNWSSPTGKSKALSNPAHSAPGKGKMSDPVKMAGAVLKRGGK